jgi:hypothetical protein
MGTRTATGMPAWVKVTIAIAVVFIVGLGILMLNGHGPWQHGGMAGLHP